MVTLYTDEKLTIYEIESPFSDTIENMEVGTYQKFTQEDYDRMVNDNIRLLLIDWPSYDIELRYSFVIVKEGEFQLLSFDNKPMGEQELDDIYMFMLSDGAIDFLHKNWKLKR